MYPNFQFYSDTPPNLESHRAYYMQQIFSTMTIEEAQRCMTVIECLYATEAYLIREALK